ncbi:uncharacterized protein LOC133730151 [Rosa rugosa]|uniref:uncharacterized protein LOC133730151 n=1 Tax=Rosa rugosa TaxID=74645 RepID=UPI002B4097F5|nr:uncharacterized protein LOC133730151 [Rosa rugosa]
MELGEKSGGRLRSQSQMQAFRQALSDCNLKDMGAAGGLFTWCDSNTKERFLSQSGGGLGIPYGGEPMLQLCRKVKGLGTHLLEWDRTIFRSRREEVEGVRAQLDALLQKPFDQSDHALKLQLSQRLNELMSIDETYWRQRSIAVWLRDGDRNSHFFHKKASNRRQKNKIKSLFDINGVWQESTAGIDGVVLDYFQHIFSSQPQDLEAQNLVLQTIEPRVSADMNAILLAPYSLEEVRIALFLMHPSKAPGSDGLSPFFFQKYWDLVGQEVSNAVISMLTHSEIPPDLNFTYVALIPKIKEVVNMSHLRPIALCNVIYKIASKVIANRLKSFLSDIISPQQSAFVPNRLISDNTLVASELAHYMHRLRRGHEGFLALKLDISKAYDRLEWGFLQRIMLKMGFAEEWVDLIMSCLSTVRYSFLVNGTPRGYVTPQRGLRQGDPLSPYLFLLCAEGMSALISHGVSSGQWQGLRICDGAPTISHLLFADDSMLYSIATPQDCTMIRDLLNIYERASGQQVNLQKSSVVFSGSVLPPLRDNMAQILGVQMVEKHDKWRSKLLSAAGREILIKVVAQALPLYTMNCYLLPQNLIQELHQLCAQFWWGSTDDKKAMHWRAWDDLCKPKSMGGMGFRHLFAFNLAMLAKQGWRLLQYPDSLIGQLFKALYFPHSNFWEAELGSQPSFAWRSILQGRDILKAGIKRHIGNGLSTNIWRDPWLMGEDLGAYFSSRATFVADLFISPGVWNVTLLSELFPAYIVQKILTLPLSPRVHEDRWIWGADKKGQFTVKSAYHVARNRILDDVSSISNPSATLWRQLWKAQVPSNVKICAWKAASNILPTRGRLSERGVDIDTQCPLCDEEVETPLHATRDCPHATSLIHGANISLVSAPSTVADWLTVVSATYPHHFASSLMILWATWRNRNAKVWGGDFKQASEIVPMSLGWLAEFKAARITTPLGLATRAVPKWSKPPVGFVKLNVDVAFDQTLCRTGLGGVFRDHVGTFLHGFRHSVTIAQSARHAELLALILGVQLAIDHHLTPLIVESDCLDLVSALSSSSLDCSELGFLLVDLRTLLHEALDARVLKVARQANSVAHILAQRPSMMIFR